MIKKHDFIIFHNKQFVLQLPDYSIPRGDKQVQRYTRSKHKI